MRNPAFRLTPPPPAYEDDIQCAIIEWADRQKHSVPALELLFHTPNGGSRNVIEAAKFKRMGVRAGVPDLMLPVPRQGYAGLCIDLKRPGEKLRETQETWRDNLVSVGWKHAVHSDPAAAIAEIRRYLDL